MGGMREWKTGREEEAVGKEERGKEEERASDKKREER